MRPTRVLCVSIHDVAPATWPSCERLLRAVHQVARIPVTLLVVPDYHRRGEIDVPRYEDALALRLAAGDELALHGWAHLDEGPEGPGWWQRYQRRTYTRGEGEFAALDENEAGRRLAAGRAWFAARGWPLEGFVPPAWLLGPGGWRALRASPLRYATTLRHFHLLAEHGVVTSPSLVYSSRNAWLRCASLGWNRVLAGASRTTPLMRLSLHPPDAHDAAVVRHFQGLLETLLTTHAPMTKASFARLRGRLLAAGALRAALPR